MVLNTVKRLNKTIEWLKEEGLDAFIVEAPIDLFYLSGKKLSHGRFLICRAGPSKLFVDGRYFTARDEKLGYELVLSPSFGKDSPFVAALKQIEGKVGFDSAAMSVASFEKLRSFAKELSFVGHEQPITQVRQIKDSEEIEILQRAALLNERGMRFVKERLREGIEEQQLAKELEIFWLQEGAEGTAFDPIIAFGENSALPHHRAAKRKLERGDIVLIDIGVVVDNYVSDMTDTLFFGKCRSEKLLSIHEIVKKAQRAALEKVKAGVPIWQVDGAARELIASYGYEKNFCHGLGHGIGLEIHELPALRSHTSSQEAKLQEGMAITIEPGIYLEGLGGVRLEQSIIVTKEGYQMLGQGIELG